MSFINKLIFAIGLILTIDQATAAPNCPSYPNTLTNGTTADANAVMGNFNSILNCANSGLAPSTGGTLTNTTLSGTTPTQKLQFPDGTTQTSAGGPSVLVRQTVMSGPALTGAPNFLPSTSSSLTLGAQNVSSAAPLTLTAAQGFGTAGAINLVYQFTSNPSWTVPASTTSYLYVNAQTGASGVTTAQPVYQSGGTPSIITGQFTFDYQAMVGYLGNGTTAVPTPLVFVGEAVAGASAITSAAAYAYNGYCDTGFVSGLPAIGGGYTNKTTNLGVLVDRAQFVVENITADQNYSVGDRLSGGFLGYSTTGTIPGILGPVINRNAVALLQPQTNYTIVNKTTGVTSAATLANWKWKIIVSRGW